MILKMKAIEDELLKASLLAFMKRKKDVLAKIDQDLEVLRERMSEFTSMFTREELEELEKVYAGVSDKENKKNISNRKTRAKRAALAGDRNPRSRRKND
jgi:hypothetical protein